MNVDLRLIPYGVRKNDRLDYNVWIRCPHCDTLHAKEDAKKRKGYKLIKCSKCKEMFKV